MATAWAALHRWKENVQFFHGAVVVVGHITELTNEEADDVVTEVANITRDLRLAELWANLEP